MPLPRPRPPVGHAHFDRLPTVDRNTRQRLGSTAVQHTATQRPPQWFCSFLFLFLRWFIVDFSFFFLSFLVITALPNRIGRGASDVLRRSGDRERASVTANGFGIDQTGPVAGVC